MWLMRCQCLAAGQRHFLFVESLARFSACRQRRGRWETFNWTKRCRAGEQ
ncbi:hypothetical protein VFPPC_15385 [Pochonia chlamydosporia 170]|uniref:Uncharacterized protein n=1 Tax=Pochonia chlamydosporia 170 TaxID=1380566 RepID=A0A179G7Z8_METCM|nr:hypothetical protein VFPPC_15385 [Pochonia chlamydosporia 170]OAQ73926.1 hypothetical protein VFPPC_15385 [Pochonia chlamydosporia 170]